MSKNRKWYSRIKNDFLRRLITPFCVCFQYKVETFIWIVFVIIAGQFGTIINVIRFCIFENWDLQPALGPDSSSGSFYSFSLVLMASLIGTHFARLAKKEKPEYRSIVIIFVTFLIFSLLFCAVFYSFNTQTLKEPHTFQYMRNDDMVIDIKQLLFLVLALLFSWYSMGLLLAQKNEGEFHLDNDYQIEEDTERNKLSNSKSLFNGISI